MPLIVNQEQRKSDPLDDHKSQGEELLHISRCAGVFSLLLRRPISFHHTHNCHHGDGQEKVQNEQNLLLLPDTGIQQHIFHCSAAAALSHTASQAAPRWQSSYTGPLSDSLCRRPSEGCLGTGAVNTECLSEWSSFETYISSHGWDIPGQCIYR